MRRLEPHQFAVPDAACGCDGALAGRVRLLRAALRKCAVTVNIGTIRVPSARGQSAFSEIRHTAVCWQRELGFRLNHLLCSPEATDRLQGAGVDRWGRDEERAADRALAQIELN